MQGRVESLRCLHGCCRPTMRANAVYVSISDIHKELSKDEVLHNAIVI